MGSHVVQNYRSLQEDEATILTMEILTNPDDYMVSIKRYTVSVISVIGWGRRVARKNDYFFQTALDVMATVASVLPEWSLVETFPWLTYMPSWICTFPTMNRKSATSLQDYLYSLSKEAARSSPNLNFSWALLERQKELGLSNAEVASLTST